jgi:hypothetical protein
MRLPLVVLTAAVLALAGCGSSPSPSSSSSAAASSDFGLPADASAAAQQAGLPMLGQEHLTVHYHAHLDVVVRGSAVTVPASIGIDQPRSKIAPLHTHTADGIVHIESATDVPFTLGQLFTEWGHPISATAIGGVKAGSGEALRVYRNGELVSGDPAAMKFEPHDEIFVWLGPAADKPTVPSSYTFPNGL